MQFKKGHLRWAVSSYPVAVKYDPKFGDAFWNSSKVSMISLLADDDDLMGQLCVTSGITPNAQKRERMRMPLSLQMGQERNSF